MPAIEVERIVPGRELCSREKRGCGVGKTKRGKGTKWMVVVEGRGLHHGRLPSLCLSDGSPARRNDAHCDPGRVASSPRLATAEAGAGDRSQSVPQRSTPKAVAAAWDRTDLPTQEKLRSAGNAGWPGAEAVQTALHRSAHQRVAGELPMLGRALRPLPRDLPGVLSYRLLYDRPAKGCAIASRVFPSLRFLLVELNKLGTFLPVGRTTPPVGFPTVRGCTSDCVQI